MQVHCVQVHSASCSPGKWLLLWRSFCLLSLSLLRSPLWLSRAMSASPLSLNCATSVSLSEFEELGDLDTSVVTVEPVRSLSEQPLE